MSVVNWLGDISFLPALICGGCVAEIMPLPPRQLCRIAVIPPAVSLLRYDRVIKCKWIDNCRSERRKLISCDVLCSGLIANNGSDIHIFIGIFHYIYKTVVFQWLNFWWKYISLCKDGTKNIVSDLFKDPEIYINVVLPYLEPFQKLILRVRFKCWPCHILYVTKT